MPTDTERQLSELDLEWKSRRTSLDLSVIPGVRSTDPSTTSRQLLLAWVVLVTLAATLGWVVPPPIGLGLATVLLAATAVLTYTTGRKVRRYKVLEQEFERRRRGLADSDER